MTSRSLAAVAGSLGLALASSPGIAAAHAAKHSAHATRHTTHVTGVVRSFNVAKHSITLATASAKSSKRTHKRHLLTFNVTAARVSGNHGAFAVGDKVTVTSDDATESGGDATTIRVIGVPNGGDNGHGAAIAGTITAVDPTAATITLSSRGEDGAAPQSVLVDITSSTILAVADGGGSVSLSDLHVGDHAVVLTADVTATPIVALGVLDSSRPGDNQTCPGLPSEPGDGPGDGGGTTAGAPAQSGDRSGVVLKVSPADNALVMEGHDSGPLTVVFSPQTQVDEIVNGVSQPSSLSAIQPGQSIHVVWTSATSTYVNASSVVFGGPATTTEPPAPPAPPAPPQSGDASGVVVGACPGDGALVMSQNGTRLTVVVGSQTLVNEIVNGVSQPSSLSAIQPGQSIHVVWTSATSTYVNASSIVFGGPASGTSPLSCSP